MPKVLHSQCFAVLEGAGSAHGMQAAEQLAKAIELIEIARLRRTAAATGEQGEAEARVFEQAFAVVDQRCDHRDFAFGQLEGEAVFFEDGVVGPALRAVELGDQWLAIFDADLIHAVFVAVKCQDAGVAEKADAFNGIEHQIGGECFKRVRHADSCAQQAAASGQAW
ncbi:hypothetical protein D3C78_978910 [compost metagenome]